MRQFPKLVKVRQRFDSTHIPDIETHLSAELESWKATHGGLDGKEIAVTVGSRGITGIVSILRVLISFLQRGGAKPFLVPAMGSHGGAREVGQREILKKYGVSEGSLGVPVRSSMEVEEIGRSSSGIPVYCDRHARSAQGVVVVNRIKDHTDFEARFESGLVKMMVIGLGKHQGAMTVHNLGIRGFREEMAGLAGVMLESLPVLFGIGIVENAYNQTAFLEVIDRPDIFEREASLLVEAKRLRPRLLIDDLDILVVREMGKEISGTCMDANVIGRRLIFGEPEPERPRIRRVVALSMSDRSDGNAVGIGLADICTQRLVNRIDFESMYINTITATYVERAKIPLTAATDREAIEIALNTCWVERGDRIRMAVIRNTKSLDSVWYSEELIPTIREGADLEVEADPAEMTFDDKGNLLL